jgi:ankyrin repeat protein
MRAKTVGAWFLLAGAALTAGDIGLQASSSAGLQTSSSAGLQAGQSDKRLVDAVKAGDKTIALVLLKQKADVNTPEADGTTALQWAVRQDDVDMTDRLLRAGADVKAANRYGITALYLACLNGDAGIIEKLVKAGADANAAVTEGETALMTAARSGHVEAAKALLAHGAVVDARENWRGQTALMWASAEGHAEMIRELAAHGADVTARSTAQKWERQVTAEPREKWLPPGGLTPLLFASRQGCLECVKALASLGADVNAADQDGISPMVSAIINGHFDVAGALLDKGADPNIADATGRAPLYAAVDFNTMPSSNRPSPKVVDNEMTGLDLVAALLDHGANPNARLKKQQPYRTKIDRGNDTMLGAGTTPFLRAARAGDAAAMRLLLKRGADPKIATGSDVPVDVSQPVRRAPGGINPLMAAAGLGAKEEDTVGRKKTESQSIEAIKVCLEAGVDINAVDGRGQTALHGAALQGYDEVVRFLAAHGAKLDIKDGRGFTPLDAAEGKAGGFGFGGGSANPHPTTAKLLRELMGVPVPATASQ